MNTANWEALAFSTVGVEIWQPVVGYEQAYEVSNLGRVRSLPRVRRRKHKDGAVYVAYSGRTLRPGIHKSGHALVNLRDGKDKYALVHRLVLDAFGEVCEPGCETRHLDSNPANNRLFNLVYGTRKENMADRWLAGVPFKKRPDNSGEKHHRAKLTNVDAKAIFLRVQQGAETYDRIAADYSITKHTVFRIAKGQQWATVTGATQ